jgi:hypothetical protein
MNSKLFPSPVAMITTTYSVHNMTVVIARSWAADFYYNVLSRYSFLVLSNRAVADYFFRGR